MNNLLAITLLSISFIAVAYPYLRTIRFANHLEKIGLAFILGSGILTLFWFLLYLAIGTFSLASILLATLLATLLGVGVARFGVPGEFAQSQPYKKLDKIILVSILFLTFLAIIISWYNPIISWDTLTLYDFRGISVADSGSLKSFETSTYYLSYPLMTSLVHAAFYLLGGDNPQIFYSLVYASILAVVYGRMMSSTSRLHAGLSTLLIAGNHLMFEHATISYTNLPYTAFLIAGILYASPSIIMSGIFLGLSTWVRSSEPFWVVGALMILYTGIRQKKYLHTIASLSIIYLIKTIWSVYLADAYQRIGLIGDTQTDIYNFAMFGKMYANLGSIATYLWQFIFTPYLGYWIVTFFAIIASLYLRSILLGAVLLVLAMVVAGVGVFSTYYESWYSIGGSATRMLLFIIPLITVMGMQLYYLLTHHHEKK